MLVVFVMLRETNKKHVILNAHLHRFYNFKHILAQVGHICVGLGAFTRVKADLPIYYFLRINLSEKSFERSYDLVLNI